jgi:raffinose/stachyose/melibiose transport system substrate-binding protein
MPARGFQISQKPPNVSSSTKGEMSMLLHRYQWMRGLSLLFVLILVVGCVAPAAPAGQTGTGAAPADATAKTKVVWWTEGDRPPEQQQALLDQFVNAFNASTPRHRVGACLSGEFRVMCCARQCKLAEGPDIIQTPGPGFLLEFQKAGLVLPMNDFADDYGWKDEILPWAYESGTLEGQLYGLPLTFESMVLLYNTKVFADLGLTPPTNRAEFDAVAKALQDAGLLAISYGNVGWQPTNEHLLGMWLNAYAGSDAVYEGLTGKRPWTDELFAGAIDMLKEDITTNGYFAGSLDDYYSFDWDTFWSTLASDKAGMMTIGTWGFRGAKDYFKDNPEGWDWVMLPALREGVPQGFDLAIGSTVSINAATEHPEAAAEVLDYLYNDPARAASIAQIFSFGEFVVPIKFAATDIPSDVDPRVARFLTEFAKVTGEGNYGYTTWTFWPAEAETQMWKDIELVWAGELTTEEYLAQHQALWDKARTDNALPPVPER